ncbi:enoyl-CoA hydratase-related protein [Paenibacillus lignilyticus]|uniref:Enoyl-CoA hydratase/isomerase family protein n=1 Tax=Paenibacillus lignilyticus TaxID=1172615 RepID=A0ABS5CK21_9BACL|nr:enoyl-CoA hydratase-related protein [Paenibacillus lignilyticus]MBP3966203.1 enoyl-CoA hydratase/isomerase family protein [Paenibacillus lignilyticus]
MTTESPEPQPQPPVLWEQRGHIGTIRLNRPESLNAINEAMLIALEEQLHHIASETRTVRVVILEGEGRAFCAGADLKERSMLTDPLQIRQRIIRSKAVFAALERLPQPTIAKINGLAFGGGLELALCCDFRYAISSARLGLTEVSLGIIPGAGGTQRLPRLIGPAKAKELILTARRITAEQAHKLGLLTDVAENEEQLQSRCAATAEELLANAPLAVYQAKRAIDQGLDLDLPSGLALETSAYEALIPTRDRLEALEAFRAKRPPQFTGE